MLINLLASCFFSNKIYMAASLNKNYIPGARALFIVILATLLDDVAYYFFDSSKFPLSNFSSIFYFGEIIIACLFLCVAGRLFGGSVRQCTFVAVFKGFSYTLSPVIFGSLWMIGLSAFTDLNITHYKAFNIGSLVVLMCWLWVCQYIFVMTYFSTLKKSRQLILFIGIIAIYLGTQEFKEFAYLFLSGSQ